MLKFTLDETKSPRLLTVTSDRGCAQIQWAGESAKAIFTPKILRADGTPDPAWTLVSNDGATAVFTG
jgi:hypothetical protein